jgi:hypothetical protein
MDTILCRRIVGKLKGLASIPVGHFSDNPVRTKPLARRTLRVGTDKQLPSSGVPLYDSGLVTEDSLFADGKTYPMINPFNQTGLERFFGTFSID